REAIFDILQERVRGKKVLDLFAGTGAWGIEALSRGAEKATFVEHNAHVLAALRRNIKECRLEKKSEVLPGDVFQGLRILASRGEVFDLIFIDPPYAQGLVKQTLKELSQRDLITPQGLIIAEHSIKEDLSIPVPWELIDRRQYGATNISFWQPAGEK
ncbi:MAG: 16S rRNA (guanine(966)-N(2))-methyltransferase RsmD, partial [bacterium]